MLRRAPQRILIALVALAAFALSACGSLPDASEPPQRHAVVSEGHPLTVYERRARDTKGSILLIHGATWSALPDFDLQVPGIERSVMRALAARGFNTYAVDLRGYGATARDASGWLTPNRAVADVLAVLGWIEQRDRRTPAVLGWSMGSLIAHLTAQRNPKAIGDLILFGHPLEAAAAMAGAPAPEQAQRQRNTRDRAVSDFISPAVTPNAVIEAYVQAALAADPIRVDWRDLQTWRELDPAQVHVPTLVLHGERDPLASIPSQATLFRTLGHADRRWIILAGGDHAALIEDTQPAFIAAIVGFLERPRLAVPDRSVHGEFPPATGAQERPPDRSPSAASAGAQERPPVGR